MEEIIKKGKNTGMAVVAYIVFFIPLLTEAKKDPFVKYHVRQGLSLFITAVVVWIVNYILVYIPIIGLMLSWLLSLFLLILLIIGIMNAVGGKKKPLPVIGEFGEKFKF
jgi:uncharacterized membrane protein